jgi:hypothetical protein
MSRLQTPDPDCPICRGRGWYEGPTYDPHFGWQTGPTPCLDCNPVEPPTRSEVLLLAFAFIALFVLMLWGAR